MLQSCCGQQVADVHDLFEAVIKMLVAAADGDDVSDSCKCDDL